MIIVLYIPNQMKLFLLIPTAILLPLMGLAKPNIIVILSDDVGWGDISANQPSNKFKTPAVDQLAK